MVHHSIAVVITSFLTNFVELRKGEVRRILLLGNSVNKGNKKGKSRGPNNPGSSSARLAPELPLGL